MVLLTLIVGYTAYNLSSRMTDLSDLVTKSVSKKLFLEEISSTVDRLVKRVDIYLLNPDDRIKEEIKRLNVDISNRFKSLRFISDKASSEAMNIDLIENYYHNNIYDLIQQIIKTRDNPDSTENTEEMLNKLYDNNFQIVSQINTLKDIAIPTYQDNIQQLKNYSKGVTLTITLVCVLLGIILMSISINHLTTLYEQIEKQAKRERVVKELTTAVCSTLDLKVIFDIATREITKTLGIDKCMILEYSDEGTISISYSYVNPDSKLDQNNLCNEIIVNKENPLLIEARETKLPLVINDVKTNKPYKRELKQYRELGILSFVIVPIILHDNRIYGFIQLENYDKIKIWTKESVELITDISNQLTIAISNAKLYKNAKEKSEEANKLAKELEKNLIEIKMINKELVFSNELNVKIQEDERLRIAQDLHDEIIQGLIGMVRKADNLLDDNKFEIQNDVRLLIAQIRKICQNLRPSILDDLGLHSAVEWLLDDLEKYGVVPHLNIEEENSIKLPEKTELVVFRVIQELTSNIKKHSKATNAWLNLCYKRNGIYIELKDDGRGFKYNKNEKPQTLGLIGIKERIKSVSGTIDIDPTIDQGTSVNFFIPFEKVEDEKLQEEVTL